MLSCFTCLQLFASLWTVTVRLLCHCDSPGKNTGVGCHDVLQGIFLTQRSNPHLLGLLYWWDMAYRILVPVHGNQLNKNIRDSLVAQTVKNLPVMQETRVQSLDQEDPLEKGIANHSSILAWRIPWTEEPGGLQFRGSQRVKHN